MDQGVGTIPTISRAQFKREQGGENGDGKKKVLLGKEVCGRIKGLASRNDLAQEHFEKFGKRQRKKRGI